MFFCDVSIFSLETNLRVIAVLHTEMCSVTFRCQKRLNRLNRLNRCLLLPLESRKTIWFPSVPLQSESCKKDAHLASWIFYLSVWGLRCLQQKIHPGGCRWGEEPPWPPAASRGDRRAERAGSAGEAVRSGHRTSLPVTGSGPHGSEGMPRFLILFRNVREALATDLSSLWKQYIY